jgi:hypothetical protein
MASPKRTTLADPLDSILQAAHERSPLYDWMDMNYERIAALTGGRRIRWKGLVAYLADQGIRDGEGKVPTAARMSSTWWKVKAARQSQGATSGAKAPELSGMTGSRHSGQAGAPEQASGASRALEAGAAGAGDHASRSHVPAPKEAPSLATREPGTRGGVATTAPMQVSGTAGPGIELTDEEKAVAFGFVDWQVKRDGRGSLSEWNRRAREEREAAARRPAEPGGENL